jgi:hypothetical protein
MKLLVFGDSHGRSRAVQRMLRRAEKGTKPDLVLFAGDGLYDALDLRYEGYHVLAVRGNCDLAAPSDIPYELTFPVNGKTIYLTHGHRLQVKQGLSLLFARAREVDAALAIYGHTHTQTLEYREGILLLNPGALRDGGFAIVTVDDHGEMSCQLFGENE